MNEKYYWNKLRYFCIARKGLAFFITYSKPRQMMLGVIKWATLKSAAS